jgi:hypothetical protein
MAMQKKIDPKIPDDLLTAQARFEAWRNQHSGKRPIPAELWDLAAQLALRHRPGLIASVLRLNLTTLKSKSGILGKRGKPGDMPLVKFAPVHFHASIPTTSKSEKKYGRPSMIAEVVSSSGISIRMFSGIDEASLKLLSQFIQEA